MKTMKKFLLGLLTLMMTFGLCFAVACAGNTDEGGSSSPTSSGPNSSTPNKEEETGTLAERLIDAVGETELQITGMVEVKTTTLTQSRLDTSQSTKITVDGGENGATVRATGSGAYAIRPYAGWLVFKNVTFRDSSLANQQANGWFEVQYLEFSHKVRFENCTFDCSIWLANDIEAEFVNCTFDSKADGLYSVWAADGDITMKDCTFTGYRGLKIHEYNGTDIKTLVVDECKFQGLLTKVGIAIGTINVDPMQTEIIVKNSTFEDCQDWDSVGSLEGIDGFYEADTYTSEFTFLSQNNKIDGISADEIDPEIS